MLRRFLALFLSLALLISGIPMPAAAASDWEFGDTYLSVGGNTVVLVEDAVYTLNEFEPTETGIYSFTAPEGVLLANFNSSFFPMNRTGDAATNSLSWTCTSVGQTVLVGVCADASPVDVHVERIGDHVSNEIQYTKYENKHTPSKANTDYCQIVADYTAVNSIVQRGEWFYGITKDGQELRLLVDFAYTNLSISAMLNSSTTKYVEKDSSGNVVVAYDYHDALSEYAAFGKYPLTEDLSQMIQHLDTTKGWTADGWLASWLELCVLVSDHVAGEPDVQDGMANYYCSGCGKFMDAVRLPEETEPVGCGHAAMVHIEAVEPGCHYIGNIEHWYCTECETVWADAELTQITNHMNVILPALGGDVIHVSASEPSCLENGNVEHWYCVECEQVWTDEALTQLSNRKNVILPTIHGEIMHVPAKEATCFETGNIEHWYCENCMTFWKDEELTQITNLKHVTLTADHEELVYVEAKDPTATENGNIEHWYCETCETVWQDAALTQVTNHKNVIIPATGEEPALPGNTPEEAILVEFEMNEEWTEGTATITVEPGVWHYSAYMFGMELTANGEPVEVTQSNPRMPASFSFTNEGTEAVKYELHVSYPVGSMSNPAELALGQNDAHVKAGSDGVYYTWTAAENGTLTVTMPEGDWVYVINNMTSYIYGDTQWSDSDPVVNPAVVEVAAGDEIQIIVNTYDPANVWSNPEGILSFTATFAPKAPQEDLIASGTCNDSATWKITTDGTLIVSGEGALYSMTQLNPGEALRPAWDLYADSIKTIIVEEGITIIGGCSFQNMKNATQVVLPNTVTCIEEGAFRSCISLTDIVLPDSVYEIGPFVFSSCHALEEITIPAKATQISSMAFSWCANLRNIWVAEGNTQYASVDGILYSKDKTTLMVYPGGRSGVCQVPAGTCKIGDYAFSDANSDVFFGPILPWTIFTPYTEADVGVTHVILPESVTEIASFAFLNCDSLEQVDIPDTVTQIGNGAFTGCTGLKSIRIPENLKELPMTVFNRTGLEEVEIPDNVQSIGSAAFAMNRNLRKVVVGMGVKSVADSIFDGEASLSEVIFLGNAPGFHENSFTASRFTAYYPADNATWTADVMQNYGGDVTWVPLAPAGYTVEIPGVHGVASVLVDGVEYPAIQTDSGIRVELADGNATNLVICTYHEESAEDQHSQYPVGMKVWLLDYKHSGYTATYVPEFDDLLQYCGMSIRVTGEKGIRMITGIDKNIRTALMGNGIAGFTLVEYGTAVAWTENLEKGYQLVLGNPATMSNYAYKRGVADPIFADTGDQIQYTNVLVGFSNDQCIPDLTMRPYIILENADGEQITVYGGTVERSIGYIAYQNRNSFGNETEAYEYVWDIIHYVYGDIYDKDYKPAWSKPVM